MNNVNNPHKLTTDINIKLGKHMKVILLHLHEQKGYMRRQASIIRDIYDLYDHDRMKERNLSKYSCELPITPSLRVASSRAFSRLEEHGLIYKYFYNYKYEYKGKPLYTNYSTGEQIREPPKPTKIWTSKPWFGITEKGIGYVNNSTDFRVGVNVKEA